MLITPTAVWVSELCSLGTAVSSASPTLHQSHLQRTPVGHGSHRVLLSAPSPRDLTLCQQQGHHLFVAFPGSFHQRCVPLIIDLLQVGSSLDQQRRQLHVPAAGSQGERGLEGVRGHVHLGAAVQQQPRHLHVSVLQAKGSPGVTQDSSHLML